MVHGTALVGHGKRVVAGNGKKFKLKLMAHAKTASWGETERNARRNHRRAHGVVADHVVKIRRSNWAAFTV